MVGFAIPFTYRAPDAAPAPDAFFTFRVQFVSPFLNLGFNLNVNFTFLLLVVGGVGGVGVSVGVSVGVDCVVFVVCWCLHFL